MIVITGFLIGAIWGAMLARRRNGKTFDIAQYAIGFGIVFAVLGMFITVAIERLM